MSPDETVNPVAILLAGLAVAAVALGVWLGGRINLDELAARARPHLERLAGWVVGAPLPPPTDELIDYIKARLEAELERQLWGGLISHGWVTADEARTSVLTFREPDLPPGVYADCLARIRAHRDADRRAAR